MRLMLFFFIRARYLNVIGNLCRDGTNNRFFFYLSPESVRRKLIFFADNTAFAALTSGLHSDRIARLDISPLMQFAIPLLGRAFAKSRLPPNYFFFPLAGSAFIRYNNNHVCYNRNNLSLT